MNNPENRLASSSYDSREEKDRRYFEKQERKNNLRVTREFESNAKKIRLGISYSRNQIEFFFDTRFNEELIAKLRDKFEFTANEDGSKITFNKIK